MRVVVVGATGNVGTAVLRRLAAAPEVDEVVGIARRLPPAGAGEPYDGVRWTACDVGADAAVDELTAAFAGAAAVVHLAWQIQPSHDPDRLHRTNVTGSANVVQAVLRAGVPALVYASSVGAYAPGPKDRFVDEDWPTTGVPGSGYSAHKAAVERLLDALEVDQPELRVVRLRPGLIFQADAGGEITRYFLGPWAPTGLLRWRRVPLVPTHPRLRTQCVHADDVADAYVRSVLSDARGAFNVAADPVLDGELLARLLGGRTVPLSPTLLVGAAALTWRARLQPVDEGWVRLAANAPLLDTARVRRELGWTATRDAGATVLELIDGAARGRGTASPVLRPRASLAERVAAQLRGDLPGHGERY
jgi:nucleoside-diphosphate-sugar epimerase